MKTFEPSLVRPTGEHRRKIALSASDRNPRPTNIEPSREVVIYPLPIPRTNERAHLPEEPVRERLHDIMSPLNAVSGYVELLENSADRPEDVERLKRYSRKIACGLEQISSQLEELQAFCRSHESTDSTRHSTCDPLTPSLHSRMAGMGN